jgi:hypothetical protein
MDLLREVADRVVRPRTASPGAKAPGSYQPSRRERQPSTNSRDVPSPQPSPARGEGARADQHGHSPPLPPPRVPPCVPPRVPPCVPPCVPPRVSCPLSPRGRGPGRGGVRNPRPSRAERVSSPLKNRRRSEGDGFCARSRRRTGSTAVRFVEDSGTKSWRTRPARSRCPVFQRAAGKRACSQPTRRPCGRASQAERAAPASPRAASRPGARRTRLVPGERARARAAYV